MISDIILLYDSFSKLNLKIPQSIFVDGYYICIKDNETIRILYQGEQIIFHTINHHYDIETGTSVIRTNPFMIRINIINGNNVSLASDNISQFIPIKKINNLETIMNLPDELIEHHNFYNMFKYLNIEFVVHNSLIIHIQKILDIINLYMSK